MDQYFGFIFFLSGWKEIIDNIIKIIGHKLKDKANNG